MPSLRQQILAKPQLLRLALNLWPPFIGAGIRIAAIDPDYRRVLVQLRLTFYNKNYVGTHFGGSLFAMTDPFFMLMLIHNLGPRYYVWDRSTQIEFLQPGKGVVQAEMRISEADLEQIKQATAQGEKFEREFAAEILDSSGKRIAIARKLIYARLKPQYRSQTSKS